MNDKLPHIFDESLKLLLSAGADEEDARGYLHELISSVPEFVGKFYHGVLRWCTDGEINVEDDAELRQLNLFLKFIKNTEAGEFYDSDFDGKSYAELVKFFHLDLTAEDYSAPEGALYSHVLIPSFETLQKYKEWTDDWCITLSDIAFDEYSEGGSKEIYPDGSVDSVTNRWNAIGEEAASEAWKLFVNCHKLVLTLTMRHPTRASRARASSSGLIASC